MIQAWNVTDRNNQLQLQDHQNLIKRKRRDGCRLNYGGQFGQLGFGTLIRTGHWLMG